MKKEMLWKHTSLSGDNGVDIIAYSNQPIVKGKYIVQCKRWSNPIGEPVIRDLCGAMLNERGTKGIVITNSSFTSKARQFADRTNIELINGKDLSNLLEQYGISTEDNTDNAVRSFIDNSGFDKEQYLYLKARIEENGRERLYYDRLQEFYHSYIINSKYEINKNGLIDEYLNFNNDYITRFCKRTAENLERRKVVEYINAFLYILKGNIFKAVEIYYDLGFFVINNHGNLYNEDYVLLPGEGATKHMTCRASILSLYLIFSFLNYKNGKSYMLHKLLTENCYADKNNRRCYERCLNESVDSLLQWQKTYNSLYFPAGYSIEKEGAKHFYRIRLKWMDLPETISQYYGYNGMQNIEKGMHKLNVLLNGGNEINLANAIKDLCGKKLELLNKNSDAYIWYSKGYMLFNLGKYKEGVEYFNKAIECYDKAIEISPEDDGAWYGKACVYSLLEDKENALRTLQKAIALDIEYKQVALQGKDFATLWNDEANICKR